MGSGLDDSHGLGEVNEVHLRRQGTYRVLIQAGLKAFAMLLCIIKPYSGQTGLGGLAARVSMQYSDRAFS